MKKKNGQKKAQYLMMFSGVVMIILSYLIFMSSNLPLFIKTLQPEFGSVGLALFLVGGVWKLTSIRISS